MTATVLPKTEHTFIADLFDTESPYGFKFSTIEECAKDIAGGSFLPRTIHECESPAVCSDVTEDVAQMVRDLCPDYRENYRLLGWLQRNGAVSNAEMAA